jgi:hypothetical protein
MPLLRNVCRTGSRNSTGWVAASYRSRSPNRLWAPSLSRRDLQKATVCTQSVCFKVITQNYLTGMEECRKIMPYTIVEMRAKIRTTYLPYTSRERCHYAKFPGLLRHSRFLDTFPKLRKATINFLSVCPHGTTRLPLDGFSWNLIFEYFSKICWVNSSFTKTGQK